MRRVFYLSSPSLLYGLNLTPFSKFYCLDLSNFYIHVHNIVWLLLTNVWEFDHLLIPSVLVTSWASQNFPFHLNFPFWFLDLDRLRDGEESSSWAGSECKHPNHCKWRYWRWGAAYRLGPYVNTHITAPTGLGPHVNNHFLILEFQYILPSLLAII